MSPNEKAEHIEVFVHSETSRDSFVGRLQAGRNGNEFLVDVRSQGIELPEGPLFLFLEDAEEELVLGQPLSELGIKHRSHVHVHRCRRVIVEVTYNGEIKTHEFSPGTTVSRVQAWAAAAFKLSPTDASEHCLQITQTTDRPDEDTHLGSLVAVPECKVSFDLVPKKRVEGDS